MTIGSPRARFSASWRRVTGLRSSRWKRGSRGGEDTDGSFRVSAPALRGRRLGVVDEARGADGGGNDDEVAGLGESLGVDGGEVLGRDSVLTQHFLAGLDPALRRGMQGGIEGERSIAFLRAQTHVPAAQCEPVGASYGGE